MSALTPKADMCSALAYVCLVPVASVPRLIEHFVGDSEERIGNVETEGLGCLKVDRHLMLGWRLHWQVSRLLTFENAINVPGRGPKLGDKVRSVGHQAAAGYVVTEWIDCGQLMPGRKRDDQGAM